MTSTPQDTVPVLRDLNEFSHIPFAASPCPAVLLAISHADPQEILAASRHAIRQVRGDTDVADISGMSLAEMDYAFTNLEFFLSRVGNYGADGPTLREWAAKPRNATIYYAVEANPPQTAPETGPETGPGNAGGTARGNVPAALPDAAPFHAVAILADDLVCSRNPQPIKISDSDVADWHIGQVFAINRMSDTRWSA